MRVAFFDLDHTLLRTDSNQLWFAYLHSHGLLGDDALARHAAFMDDYDAGRLDFYGLLAFRRAVDASIAGDVLRSQREAFTRECLIPSVAPRAPALLDALRGDGKLTMMISASPEALVLPVARHLGFEYVLAADSIAGQHLPAPCFGPGKVLHAEAALATIGTSLATLEHSCFYSDSHNDLPLLEAVQRPVAVDPDATLAQIALERAWPVISLR